MQGEFEIPLDELRIEAPEVGIGLIASLHHSHESVAQLFPRHTEGNDVRAIFVARLLVVQPPHLFETIVERRRGYRVQHADERSRDACLVEEFGHRFEDRRIVVIKADDHAAPDVNSVTLHSVHAFQKRSGVRTHILVLLGLAQRVLIRRLYPDEDVLEISQTHQLHELFVLGQV